MNKQSSEVKMNETNWWTTPDGMRFQIKESINSLNVRFKKLRPDAVTPTYAKDGDAGLDLTSVSKTYKDSFIEYGTGIAVEIPYGYVGLVFPRSSITKTASGVSLKNSVGIIDSGYRGEIMLRFEIPTEKSVWDGESEFVTWKDGETGPLSNRENNLLKTPSIGERIGQLMIIPYPTIYLEEVDELSSTDRGEGGFGSTGV
jgi:dUTP pyrophosphatase